MDNSLHSPFNFQLSDAGNLLHSPVVNLDAATRHENVVIYGNSTYPFERIEQMLIEEEDNWSNFDDTLALQAMENSFYQVLTHGKNYSCPPINRPNDSIRSLSPTQTTGPADSFFSENLDTNTLSMRESALLFMKGAEEANKFLPRQVTLSFGGCFPRMLEDNGVPLVDSGERECSTNHIMEKKEEISELFEKLFLNQSPSGGDLLVAKGSFKPNRAKKRKHKEEVVDLESLLLYCARAMAEDDRYLAGQLLKRIWGHSSATGDGLQRCVHYFADGLEARLAGTGADYLTATSKSLSEVHVLKAAKALISGCPFRTVDFTFAVHHITKLAEGVHTVHIIDFGIVNCFRWFKIIKELALRPDGPPAIRITGIEYPQPAILPAEFVKNERRRLTKYCERYHVPVEYSGIVAQRWELIGVDDFKIHKDETIIVNCTLRFEKLLDEVNGMDGPRSIVLDLIRKINPNLFIHTIMNRSLHVSTFNTRFREAFHYFSAVYDMLDSILTRESEERETIEREYLGWSIVNVVACEGSERIDRPKTYKQWQAQTAKGGGFRSLPLDTELMRRSRDLVESEYHTEYLIEEDKNWLLQGWKGRILCATCFWVPDKQS